MASDLILHATEALPGGREPRPVALHLAGIGRDAASGVGFAWAPTFNRAVHPLTWQRTANGTVEIAATLVPDAWVPPAPQAAHWRVAAGLATMNGTAIGEAVSSAVLVAPAPPPQPGDTVRLTCQQALTDGRRDFRDIRIELPFGGGDGIAVALHEHWGLPAATRIVAGGWDGPRFDLTVAIERPGTPERAGDPAAGLRLRLTGERRGHLIAGRCAGSPAGEGPLWGSIDPVPAPRTVAVRAPALLLSAERLRLLHGRRSDPSAAAAFAPLRTRRAEWVARSPCPHARLVFIHHFGPGPVRDLKLDAEAAWGAALLHHLDGDAEAGAAAARLVLAWARTNCGITDVGGHLAFGYCLPAMIWAAALLRSDGLLDACQDAEVRRWLAEIVRPIVRVELHRNNWMAWAVACELAIALHAARGDWIDLAVRRYTDLATTYLGGPEGATGETRRDLIHAQMGLAPMLLACEMAWHQQIDLYALRGHRLAACVEFHAPFALGDLSGWPYPEPANDPGKPWPMYELALAHGRDRLGLALPQTERACAATRPEGFDRIGWGTLLHAIR